jgi:predicted nucleic acid-binding protein
VNIALDTNVLVYFEAINTPKRTSDAIGLIESLRNERLYVSSQTLGELFHVLVRKGGLDRAEARERVDFWCNAAHTIDTSTPLLYNAMELAVSHQLQIWDSIIVSAAATANCQMLLSEDLQHGFTWEGVTVVNPFHAEPHWLMKVVKESEGG